MVAWFKGLSSNKRIGLVIVLIVLLVGGGYLIFGGHKTAKTASTTVDPQLAGSQTKDNGSPSPGASATSSTSPTPTHSPTPTPSGATPAPSPTLPPAVYADNFTGHWYINFGDMTLSQTGTHVTGTYYNGPSAASGTIDGTVNGQTLTATWVLPSANTHGPMSLVKGTHTLSGNFNSTYKWCGALSGYQFPADCGFAGHWVTNLLASGSNCAMDLVRTNNSITGTYCNGTVSGTVSYPVNNTKLAGTWKIGSSTGPINFFLSGLGASPHQLYFQGNYNTGSQTNNYWCGGTIAANQPSTCLKT